MHSLLLSALLCPALAQGLDRAELLSEISLPDRSRPEVEARSTIPIPGPWRLVATARGVRTWEAELPVRPRSLFTYKPPDDMAVKRNSGKRSNNIRHEAGWEAFGKASSWSWGEKTVQVRRPASEGPPAEGEYSIVYKRALERERCLNRAEAQGKGQPALSDADFVLRSVQIDDTTRHGLYLPAPASLSIAATLPEGAELRFDARLIPPEIRAEGLESDGADLILRWLPDGGAPVQLGQVALGEAWETHRLPLPVAGPGRLQLSTDPRGDNTLDYAFVAEPIIHVPDPAPPRVILIFIDTLRQDHMSLYGYERPTTPHMDAWAADAAIFEEARSVAPWTLPSSRTMLTGRDPEWWGSAQKLQRLFADQGWATAFLAGNVYLSSNFGMAQGWGRHQCINWPRAQVQVDRALAFLEEQADRPSFLLLHFMDMHLPYREPPWYLHRFAGERPGLLAANDFLRGDVTRVAKKLGEAGQQYIRDRYDNNLAYIDDQLARLWAELRPQDTVLVIADHGEEFWDHDGFEHGHSLYDELLRIPMVLKGPGVQPGRYQSPTSTLDVAPTLASAAGLDISGMTGLPLQLLADGSRKADFDQRPLAFGRPLYGERRWGVLSQGLKYSTSEGQEELYQIAQDPGEQKDLSGPSLDRGPHLQAMSQALGWTVRPGLRLYPNRPASTGQDLKASLRLPGGIAHVVIGEDPTLQSEATAALREGDPEVVDITWSGRQKGVREVFVVPAAPLEQVLPALSLELDAGRSPTQSPGPAAPPPFDGSGQTLLTARSGGRSLALGYSVVPVPAEGTQATAGADSESTAALQALGYVEEGAEHRVMTTLEADAAPPCEN